MPPPRSLIALVLTLPLLAAAAPAAPRGLEFEDLRQVVSVIQPAISPDGSRVVYVRSSIDWKNDRRDAEIVLVDVKSAQARVLTRDRIGATQPLWAPDNSAIAYLASPERGKPAQLYVLPMNGGDSHKITDAARGVDGFVWRPDSRAFAYTTQDEAPDKKQIEKHLDSVVITDNDYLTRETPQPTHVWTVDAGGGNATRVTSGTWSVAGGAGPVWSPDGNRIYYQRQPDPIFAHFVAQTTYVHDLKANTDAPLGYGVDAYPKVSHDGDAIAVAIPRHGSLYLQADLSVRSLAGGRELFGSLPVDRNVHGFEWLPHDDGLILETADGVRNVAWIVKRDGTHKKLDLGDVDLVQASVAGDGGIAFVGQRRDHFSEIFYLAPGAAAPKQLTDENAWLASFKLGRSEPFTWMTDLGVPAIGVLTYPVDYTPGKKYPLVFDIHGGPVSTSTWNITGVEAALQQVLAKRGYFVFRPNYRGSDNQGDAFLQAIVGDMASGPGRDNLAAVEALRKTGMFDETRIFVSGWSGGGLQTSWLIGHATFWRAAVSGAAVNDMYQQAVLADINENFQQTFFAGALPFTKDGRAKYAFESPITYVAAIKTPTLILSDTRDQRVPVPQSFELYHALKERGVSVQFTVFPRYGHFPADPVGQEQVLKTWAGWFDRWMK